MKPDDGWLVQPKHIAFWINIIRFCVCTDCCGARGWLRHCATSRKVAGSISGGVIGIFLSIYLSGLVTAVAVLRNPNTIPFCLSTDLLLNVLFSWLLVYFPSTFFLDVLFFFWNFSLAKSFRANYGPGVDSTSNRNASQEYFLGVKAAGA